MLGLLALLAPPALLGIALARLLGFTPRTDRLGWLAWSWMLGAMATALVTFVWLWTPLRVDSGLVPSLAVLALAALAWWLGRSVAPVPPAPLPAAPAWETWFFRGAVLFLCVLALQRMLDGNLFPIFEDDEAHVWALKAKVIFHSGGFTPAFEEALRNEHFVYHRDYPLLNPLLHLWTFAHRGEITHVVNRVPIQLFALAFVPALAAALRQVVRPAAAVALLFLVMQATETARQGRTAHSDMAIALGTVVLFDAWMRWRAEGEQGWWRLACVGAALMMYAKGEGLLLAAAIGCGLVATHLLRRRDVEAETAPALRPRARRAWLLLPLFIVAQTWLVNASFGFENDISVGDMREDSFPTLLATQWRERLGPTLAWSWERMFSQMAWAGHTPALFAVLGCLLARRLRTDALALPGLALIAAFVGILLVFLGTPHDIEWHLATAASRVSWQLTPAIALWVGAVAGRFLPGFRGELVDAT
ncbi:MAG: hypothetical protein AAF682_23795 [Planctomycetota bacterium]